MKSTYCSEIDSLGVVLFIGRNGCSYSKRIKKLLEKSSKKFYYFESSRIGEKINKKYLKLNYDYIFCFRSFYILKKNLIEKCKMAPINFHPGPPEYRGIGCVNYAFYDNSKFYGCCAHIINDKIDNGKILNVRKFRLKSSDTIEGCLTKTYNLMLKQAFYVINLLCKNPYNLQKLINNNKKIKWSKKIKKLKELNNFYEIKKSASKKEILNKIRATNTKNFKPYVILHNKKFILHE